MEVHGISETRGGAGQRHLLQTTLTLARVPADEPERSAVVLDGVGTASTISKSLQDCVRGDGTPFTTAFHKGRRAYTMFLSIVDAR